MAQRPAQLFLYRPGRGIALAGQSLLVLLPDTSDGLVSDVWGVVGRPGATIDAIADVLARHGLRSIPSFGVAWFDDSRVHVLLRGDVSLDVSLLAGAREHAAGTDAVTWMEHSYADVGGIRLRMRDASGDEWPLIAGVVRASSVARGTISDDGGQPAR